MKGNAGFLNSRKESENKLAVKSYHDKKKRQLKTWCLMHNIKQSNNKQTYDKRLKKWVKQK